MDTSLIISSTNSGKKLQKAITNINPDKDNAVLKTFAQKVNALTTNNYVDATRVNKMSVEEEYQQGGGGLLDPQLACNSNGDVTFLGNGKCDSVDTGNSSGLVTEWLIYLESDGTYAKDWIIRAVMN